MFYTISDAAPAPPRSDVGRMSAMLDKGPKVGTYQRRILEYCCSPDSLIGRHAPADCCVVRITEAIDARSSEGRFTARAGLCTDKPCLLWGSLPCTGGSPWVTMNMHMLPGFAARLRVARKIWKQIWNSFVEAAEAGGKNMRIALEWPRYCTYWKRPEVKKFIKQHGLKMAFFDGCQFGLRAPSTGMAMKKPWCIATNDDEIYRAFSGKLCPGDHEHSPCHGSDSKASEGYTTRIVSVLHKAWALSAKSLSSNRGGDSKRHACAAGGISDTDCAHESGYQGAANVEHTHTSKKQQRQDKFREQRRKDRRTESGYQSADSDADVPAMPCVANPGIHRQKVPTKEPPFNALVARPVGKAEIRSTPEAQAALDKEWNRLLSIRCWREDTVRELYDVAEEARRNGTKAHFGRLFELCVEKNSEQPKDSPHRKFKGRSVFQGNNVRGENADVAIFGEMSSSPATMEAGKAVDYYGLFPGHNIEQADAEQAYTQARLKGIPTWVELPRERWPAHWVEMKRPCCLLDLALYGHPDSGGHWENHCEGRVVSQGFIKIPGWLSCYFHPELKLFLVIYVDDFKLAGPKENLAKGWSLIRGLNKEGIRMDEPTPLDRYLGCHHIISEQVVDERPVRMITYDMGDFLASCVDRYVELANIPRTKLKKVATPYLTDRGKVDFQGKGDKPLSLVPGIVAPPEDVDETGDEIWAPEEDKVSGHLASIASRVLMKILYAARMARYDLLRPTCYLATKVTKWTRRCDRLLHRLVSYINSSIELTMVAFVGDDPANLQLRLFTDADLAGEETNAKSTSGVFLALSGEYTFAPASGISKKQTCVSHSTPEAEMLAGDLGLRTVGLPALSLWSVILGREPVLEFNEDNEAAVQIIKTGKSPALRHVGRTHKLDIGFLHDLFRKRVLSMRYCESEKQCADIFTKVISEDPKWAELLVLVAHVVLSRPCSGPASQELTDYIREDKSTLR